MVIGLPTVIFTIAGGSAFGLIEGTLYSTLGATIGAAGACWMSRYLLHQWAAQRFRRHPTLRKFQRGIRRRSLWFVIVVRLSPVTPFNIENYLFGLTSVSWRPYLCGTVLGILPGTIAYTWVGVTGAEALKGESALTLLLSVIFLMAISLLPILFNRK
ncbi:MAG: TVP38/TMEM64 family protein [Cyanobacteria bacterium J06621_11]